MEEYQVDKYENILASLAADSISAIAGVSSPVENRKRRNVQVYVFDGNNATVDVNINVDYGYSVKDVAYHIQTSVKRGIESRTDFVVSNVNVNIIGVIMPIS